MSKDKNRDFLIKLLPKNSVGAEIGVWKGQFSLRLLKELNPEKLFLIDPWCWEIPGNIPKDNYIASTKIAKNQDDMDKLYKSVVETFKIYDNVKIIREPSDAACCGFFGCDLDWVYIDGSHDYDNVINDLNKWAPKVKLHGLLCGDDYDWGHKYQYPVRKAVANFLSENDSYEKVTIKNGQFVLKRIK